MKESSEILYIETTLKNLLRLFEEDAILAGLQLGDTWHPFSGYVDEKIFNPNPTVKTIMKHNHDFRGLVLFKARIGSVQIEMTSGKEKKYVFAIKGPLKAIINLEELVAEKSIYEPGLYKLQK